jgi:hypothetical protein
MDHHRQLRLSHMKLASLELGMPRYHRLPLSTTPSARPACDSAGPAKDLNARFTARILASRKEVPCQPSEEHISAQVKQLQFWLKVFSRFCQEEKD